VSIPEIHKHFKECSAICTDTRKLKKDALFIALKGPSFNGNKFVSKALEDGCKYAIVDELEYHIEGKTILVEDVLSTLQKLSTYHRKQFDIPIIGITGSNGKTTTKELVHAVLSEKYETLATIGNFNNHIGVPLTLLRLQEKHEIAIVEMGANHVGEIAELCKIAQPNFGIITNIGKAHIGEFGGYENIKIAKSELYRFIESNNGHLFINSDDSILNELQNSKNKTSYGTGGGEYQGIISSNEEFLAISVSKPDLGIVRSQLFGNYNLHNILSAIAIGDHFDVYKEDIKKAIENYIPGNNRSQILKTEKNKLILDAYNANPTSMIAALENFLENEHSDKFFILGDMLELGEDADIEHQKIINWTKENNLKGIFVGDIFCKNSVPNQSFPNVQEVIEKKAIQDLRNKVVLIKGSRGIKLEQLKELL